MSAQPPGGILVALADRFGPSIDLRVSPESFVFSGKESTCELPTLVTVEPTSSGLQLVSPDKQGNLPTNGQPLSLFPVDSVVASGIDPGRALEVLLRVGILRAGGSKNILRPLVIVRGAASLEAAMSGHQTATLVRAIIAAGAREVRFEESSSTH